MKKKITDIWKFLTYDIWRITEDEVTRTKFSLYNIIKTIYLFVSTGSPKTEWLTRPLR